MSLWFVSRNRHGNGHRKRVGEVLFIDARKLGTMVSRKLRELPEADIGRIAGTYHAWRNVDGAYEDVIGFCRAASRDEIAKHDFVLTPGRYVGAVEADLDDELIEDRLERLTKELFGELDTGRALDEKLRESLRGLTHE